MKVCNTCGESKPVEVFGKHRGMRDGLQPVCKPCGAEWLRKHRRENPEYWLEQSRKYKAKNREQIRERSKARYRADRVGGARKALGWRLKRDYGLTLEEYDELVSRPCEICGGSDGVVLDHDHTTDKVRGPLCQMCNTAIGKFADDPDRLRAAADYIETHR